MSDEELEDEEGAAPGFTHLSIPIPRMAVEERRALQDRLLPDRDDPEAMRQLLTTVEGFVLKLASHYMRRNVLEGADFSDLVAAGRMGAWVAAKKFDLDRIGEITFGTYAGHWIKQFIRRTIFNDGRTIRVPVHAREGRIERADDGTPTAVLRGGRRHAVDIGTEKGVALVEASRPRGVLSLNRPLHQDSDSSNAMSFLDTIVDPSIASDERLVRQGEEARVRAAVARLPPIERFILEQRFGVLGDEERTLVDIGEEMGLSRERIRQLETRAIGRLRVLLRPATAGPSVAIPVRAYAQSSAKCSACGAESKPGNRLRGGVCATCRIGAIEKERSAKPDAPKPPRTPVVFL